METKPKSTLYVRTTHTQGTIPLFEGESWYQEEECIHVATKTCKYIFPLYQLCEIEEVYNG